MQQPERSGIVSIRTTGDAAASPAQPVLLGLIGHPIKSSASPFMHEAAAEALGLRAQYRLIEVAGADTAKLRVMLAGVRLLGFAGVNVTFPYKEAVVPLLDEVSPAAARIGAVNTVVVRDGRLVGHNTDASGFGQAFKDVLGGPVDGPAALIGAGGVGSAIAVTLAELGLQEIRIFDHDRAKAAALAARLPATSRVTLCPNVGEALHGAAGVVNATPVGMLPDRNSPVPDTMLHGGLWVADVVYTPLWTPLLLAARARGARVMTGRELCLHQAADAFRLFTGMAASIDRMGAAFDAVMAQRDAEVRGGPIETTPARAG